MNIEKLETQKTLPAHRNIQGRADLSFTWSDADGRIFSNWNARQLSLDPAWSDDHETGMGYFAEVVELAGNNEEEAYKAVRFALCDGWRGRIDFGVESGFAEALAKVMIVGLRALREGAKPFEPSKAKPR